MQCWQLRRGAPADLVRPRAVIIAPMRGELERARHRHGWWRHTAAVMGAIAAFMIAAALADWPWWQFAFRSDLSAVSWLSSALLLANAAVALNLTLSRLLPRLTGSALTLAMALLALDEQFQLHERLQESALTGRFGQAPTLLVGAIGIVFAIAVMAAIKSRPSRALLAAGVVVGLFALWVDVGAPPPAIAMFEEGFEALAEGLFLCGLLEMSRAHVQSSVCPKATTTHLPSTLANTAFQCRSSSLTGSSTPDQIRKSAILSRFRSISCRVARSYLVSPTVVVTTVDATAGAVATQPTIAVRQRPFTGVASYDIRLPTQA
jgi:hypothetical protein